LDPTWCSILPVDAIWCMQVHVHPLVLYLIYLLGLLHRWYLLDGFQGPRIVIIILQVLLLVRYVLKVDIVCISEHHLGLLLLGLVLKNAFLLQLELELPLALHLFLLLLLQLLLLSLLLQLLVPLHLH
jgi:hypothetical protein